MDGILSDQGGFAQMSWENIPSSHPLDVIVVANKTETGSFLGV